MPPPKSQPRSADEPPVLATVDVLTILQALSDPVRLEIVRQLAGCQGRGEMMCSHIELPVGKSTGTHHLKVLFSAGVTAEREEGTRKYVRLRRTELDARFPGLMDVVLRELFSAKIRVRSHKPSPGRSRE
jgi:DNA-binding transcriptional ArsR family regulator